MKSCPQRSPAASAESHSSAAARPGSVVNSMEGMEEAESDEDEDLAVPVFLGGVKP